MGDVMDRYYLNRFKLRELYKINDSNSENLIAEIKSLKSTEMSIDQININISKFVIEITLINGANYEVVKRVSDYVLNCLKNFAVNNIDRLGLSMSDKDYFLDQINKSANSICDFSMVSNNIMFIL